LDVTAFNPDYGPVYCPYEFDSRLSFGPGKFTLAPGPGQRLWYRAVVFYRTQTGGDPWANPATYWFFRDFDSVNNFGYNFLNYWTNYTLNTAGDLVYLNVDPGYYYAVAEQWYVTSTADGSVLASSAYRWDNDVFYSGVIDTQSQVLACSVP
jgi:hypothetical protein